jgi:hypothetical protein
MLAMADQLTRARAVVAVAFEREDLDANEREYFDAELDPGVSLAKVRELIADLRLLAWKGSALYFAANEFLDSTPNTRGGVFEQLDRDDDPPPQASPAALVVARWLVNAAFNQRIIDARTATRIAGPIVGDVATTAAVRAVHEEIAALVDAHFGGSK